MNPRFFSLALPVFLLLTALLACSGKSGDDEDIEPIEFDVQITVENRNWQNIVIFALRGGNRVRLGMVTSMSTQIFTIKSEMTRSSEFQLMADPVGALDVYHSDPVRIEPGDQIHWTLASNLVHSGIFVY